jgi:hypothetical protein
VNDPRPRIASGAASRDRVDRGEALEHPDRVVRAEDGDAGSELEATRAGRDRGEDGLRARDGVLRAVVLAEGDHVDAEIVGEDGFVDHLPDRGGLREGYARIVHRHVAEGVETHHEVAHRSSSTS